MKSISVHLEFTPLGDCIVSWCIPTSILKNKEKIEIEVPGFKYDLPKFLNIPVPFSSIALPTSISMIKSSKGIKSKILTGKFSNLRLEFLNFENISSETIKIVYTIKSILNADGIYFVTVYPFRSPFIGIKHKISITAKYSYNISQYRFWERYFTFPSNKPIPNKPNFKSNINSDLCEINGTIIPKYDETLDLHLTGTRFPIFIRRDRFWLGVYLFLAIPIIWPIISFVLNELVWPSIQFIVNISKCF
jgi:hypothetical protein